MELDISKVDIKEVRDEANLILFNSPIGSIETLKLSNKICELIENGKIKIHIN